MNKDQHNDQSISESFALLEVCRAHGRVPNWAALARFASIRESGALKIARFGDGSMLMQIDQRYSPTAKLYAY